MSPHRQNRSRLPAWPCLLALSLALLLAVAACRGPEDTDVHTLKRTADEIYQEAPELARLVEAGELPPVEERLPLNPMVVPEVERTGSYGGTWRRAMLGSRDQAGFIRVIGYENLMRWNREWTRPVPNVAQSVDVNADATVYTFHLRRNMRWSDGQPFTADDILFWHDYILKDRENFPDATPAWLGQGRDSLTVVKKDERTVEFRLRAPDGLLLQKLAHPTAADPTSFPRHYVCAYLPTCDPGAEERARSQGAADWRELFERKVGRITHGGPDHPSRWANPDMPTLNAWILRDPYVPGGGTVRAVRNPYYWKIDRDGRQLPYIGVIEFRRAASADELLFWALSGELDMQIRHLDSEHNRGRLEETARNRGFRLLRTISAGANVAAISFNFLHQDPEMRALFSERKFRVALSLAIDRQKIVESLYPGHAPAQVAPQQGSPLYNATLATQYLAVDRAMADKLLDEIGLVGRDHQGFRILGDGRRLVFTVLVPENFADFILLMDEHVLAAWRSLGLDARMEVLDQADVYARTEENRHDAVIWRAGGGLDVISDPCFYLPVSAKSLYAVPWGRWYQNPADPRAQVPPLKVQKQMQLYARLTSEADARTQMDLMREILEISAEQFYVIGICRPAGGVGVVSTRMRNVPATMPASWTYPEPAPSNPAQYFFDPVP